LENDEAFWGFVWKIAENTLRSKIRKKKHDVVEIDESYHGTYWKTPEEEVIKSEELNLLRRELSLLSNQYREVTVQYYIYGKSCSQISAELHISTEMVKYYLFKTRKILKEGIGMTREFGEKSYNPQTFRMDFWGYESSAEYWDIFKRRLPGNILLAAKDKPVSLTELSIELGVAVVYLEDEVAILESHELLKKVGEKYQTNIIIFTSEYEVRVQEKFEHVYTAMVDQISKKLDECLPELKTYSCFDRVSVDNNAKWIYANIAMFHAISKFNEEVICGTYGSYPMLSNGSRGFIFGYDNDYDNHHFHGIYNYDEGPVRISINNYRVIENCQHWETKQWHKGITAMIDAVVGNKADEKNEELIHMINEGFIQAEDGVLSANFPVFTYEDFYAVKLILVPVTEMIFKCISEICAIAAETLRDYVPKALRQSCTHLAYVNYQTVAAALLVETMVQKEYLVVPNERINLCMFGVKEK
ncbi:MAG: sigma-70 family RNA polymerase sigma factor, partial [Lachnospiraceae bacterium]|nr:sigma-70 family RNA polymerase sigma factor [Lachnospiraceae bacterium]